MTGRPFRDHRQAALALLAHFPDLDRKAAGFLGHCCVDTELTLRQGNWLAKLLDYYGLPPFAGGGGNG
jgi:hypothetical protein